MSDKKVLIVRRFNLWSQKVALFQGKLLLKGYRKIQKIYELDPLTCPQLGLNLIKHARITFMESEVLLNGFAQDLKTVRGDSDGCDICYLSFLFRILRKLQFDLHILNHYA